MDGTGKQSIEANIPDNADLKPTGPPSSPGARQWLVTLAALLLPVVFFFGLLEGAARLYEMWNPPMRVDLGQGFDDSSRLFIPDPADRRMMVTNPDKAVSFKKQSFERVKPPRTLRVFALGGSSVNYLDYEFPLLAERLQKESGWERVEIINCGGLSYGSHRLVLIAREILHYEPDMVMIYSGHNEFEEMQQMGLARVPFAPAQRMLARSALYRFLRDWSARRQIAGLEAAARQRALANSIPDSSKSWAHVFTPEEIAGRMRDYRENLTAIITLCRERNVPVVIGTVPSNLVKPSLPGREGERYEQEVRPLFERGDFAAAAALGREILRNASPRHQSSDVENGILRELSRELSVPLADVEAAVIAAEPHGVPGETLFNDHCHLNPEGNKLLIREYEARLLELMKGLPAKP